MSARSEWYTAKDLAALGLPGLPGTVQGINKLAKRDGWLSRPRQGRGGGVEYRLSSLPETARIALLDRAIATLPETVCPLPVVAENTLPVAADLPDLPAPANLKGWQRRAMDARCALLNYLAMLAATHGMNKALSSMEKAARAGSLPPHLQDLVASANARGGKNGGRSLSRPTLLRWKRQLAEANGNPVALAPDLDKLTSGKRVPAWAAAFLTCYRTPDKPSVQDALDEMEEQQLLPPGVPLPSVSQCYRLLKKMSAVDRERGRRTGNDLKALRGYRRRDTSDLVPCEIYQCDGHSFKARVAHPVHGKPFHPEVCAVIDAATRVVMGWSAGLSESNQTVADALRHACTVTPEKEYGGIPAIFYTDPGSGNTATVNADPAIGRYARLGITFLTGIVGNSQARGMVERLQQTLWIKAAKKLPTFTGKSMDGSVLHKTTRLVDAQIRKHGKSELLPSWPQFLDLCAREVERYNNRPHSSLPKVTDAAGRRRHMTPLEAWQVHIARGWVPPTLSLAEINDCFRPHIKVTARRSEVRLFGNTYFHKELEHHGGEEVLVEYEVQDASRVWVRDLDERLICVAEFEANKSRHHEVTATDKAMEQREKRRLALVERKAEEIREEGRGLITATTRPALEVVNPAALEAARYIEAEMLKPQPTADISTPEALYARWKLLEARQSAGEVLSAEDKRFFQGFAQSPDWRAMQRMEEDFGAFYLAQK